MIKDITPKNSVCPIYLDPIDAAQIEMDQTAAAQFEADKQAKEQARAAVLAKLGLTADEAAALLG